MEHAYGFVVIDRVINCGWSLYIDCYLIKLIDFHDVQSEIFDKFGEQNYYCDNIRFEIRLLDFNCKLHVSKSYEKYSNLGFWKIFVSVMFISLSCLFIIC